MAYSEELAKRIREVIDGRPGVVERKMFTGRPMRGFVMVEAAALATAPGLGRWVEAGADFAEALPPK